MENGQWRMDRSARRDACVEKRSKNGQFIMDNGEWTMDRSAGHDASLGAEHRFARHGAAHRVARRIAQEVRGRRNVQPPQDNPLNH